VGFGVARRGRRSIELDGGYMNLAADKRTGAMACGLASRGADRERPEMVELEVEDEHGGVELRRREEGTVTWDLAPSRKSKEWSLGAVDGHGGICASKLNTRRSDSYAPSARGRAGELLRWW
jgi:hypothetical protein